MTSFNYETSKVKASLDAIFDCLKCKNCGTHDSKPMHGLCFKHIFCQSCGLKINTCPICKTPLNLENRDVHCAFVTDFMSLAQRITSKVERIEPDERKDEETADKKILEKKSSIQPDIKVQSDNEKNPSPTASRSSSRHRSSIGIPNDINKRNKKGETLLHVACNKGKIEEVTRLLNLGAKCSTKDFAGWTPLHEVAQRGRIDLARLLLENGAKTNVPGDNLNTPLHEAAQNGSLEMVQLLMQYGAHPDQQNLYGFTPRNMTKDPLMLEAMSVTPTEPTSPKSSISDLDSILSNDYRHILVMSAGLKSSQQAALKALVKSSQLTSTGTPSNKVNVIVTSALRSICDRSVAVLTGLCLGAWIVNPDWLEMCHKNGVLVDLEQFELYGVAGNIIKEAPKRSRQNCKDLMPGLFAGCHFYFYGNFNLTGGLSRKVLVDLVEFAGGVVLSRSPDPENIPEKESTKPFHAPVNGPLTKLSHIIIYQPGVHEPKLKYNMQHIKALSHLWLLACIENFTLLDPQKL